MLKQTIYDPLKSYLKAIGTYPLLTMEQEKGLGRIIQSCLAIIKVEEDKKISERSEECRQAEKELRVAADLLACSNLRLAISIAKKYLNNKISMEDLVQVGDLGLLDAVRRFDPERGTKFSTYATYWIKRRIREELTYRSRLVRIPQWSCRLLYKIKRMRSDSIQSDMTVISLSEFAEKFGISLEKALIPYQATLPVWGIFDDMSEDPKAERERLEIDRAADLPAVRQKLSEALLCLCERDREVMKLRYGLMDGECWSQEKIGGKFGLRKQRIKQIEDSSLAALRQTSFFQWLKDYLTP